jgi:hypothetical protein
MLVAETSAGLLQGYILLKLPPDTCILGFGVLILLIHLEIDDDLLLWVYAAQALILLVVEDGTEYARVFRLGWAGLYHNRATAACARLTLLVGLFVGFPYVPRAGASFVAVEGRGADLVVWRGLAHLTIPGILQLGQNRFHYSYLKQKQKESSINLLSNRSTNGH